MTNNKYFGGKNLSNVKDITPIGRVHFAVWTPKDSTASTDLDLGLVGNSGYITGAGTINAIKTAGFQAGDHIYASFTGAATLKHSTAGGAGTAPMLLAGSADALCAAHTMFHFWFDGSQWEEVSRKVG